MNEMMMQFLVNLSYTPKPSLPIHQTNINNNNNKLLIHRDRFTASASNAGGTFSLGSVFKKCETCRDQGAVDCPGCKGTGRNKKNGNIFERWKCFECQGFGMKGCPECGKGGLTPEQRRER